MKRLIIRNTNNIIVIIHEIYSINYIKNELNSLLLNYYNNERENNRKKLTSYQLTSKNLLW